MVLTIFYHYSQPFSNQTNLNFYVSKNQKTAYIRR